MRFLGMRRYDLASVHNNNAVAKYLGFVHIMRGHMALTPRSRGSDEIPHRLRGVPAGQKASCRLVEERLWGHARVPS